MSGTAAGIDASIGFRAEASFGTYLAPNRFTEFLNESLKLEIERVQSKGITAGRRISKRWRPGVKRVTGDINLEFGPENTGLLLNHVIGGSVSTSPATAATHARITGTAAPSTNYSGGESVSFPLTIDSTVHNIVLNTNLLTVAGVAAEIDRQCLGVDIASLNGSNYIVLTSPTTGTSSNLTVGTITNGGAARVNLTASTNTGSAAAGTAPYTHTFTPGALDGKSMTIQVGRPQLDGTIVPFSYTGCSFTSFEFAANVNEFLTLKLGVFGVDEVTSETLEAPSYPTYTPFVFTEGVLTIAGTAYDVTQFSLGADNKLKTNRHFIRSGGEVSKIAKENGWRDVTGSISSDFIDQVAYNRFKTGTEAALVLTFTGTTGTLVITTNVRFDGETPTVGGEEMLEQSLPFVCTSGTSDAAAFTVALTNSDSTP